MNIGHPSPVPPIEYIQHFFCVRNSVLKTGSASLRAHLNGFGDHNDTQ